MAMTYEAANDFLSKSEDGKPSLANHLAETLLKVLNEQPSENHELFEHISVAVKDVVAEASAKIPDAGEAGEASASIIKEQQNAWVGATTKLFPKKVAEGEEPEDEGEPQVTQNLPEEMTYFEGAGISIGRTDTYILHKSIQKLAASAAAKNMRFWGKIVGTEGDYYIAEAENEEVEIPEGFEGAIEDHLGGNKYSYWVCSYPGGPWEKLELLHPAQVVAARKLKKFFTGKLNAEVSGYPPFAMKAANGEIVTWQEKHLLRAQIARISSACVITPAGVFDRDEEEGLTITPGDDNGEDNANLFENTDYISDLGNWRQQHLETNKLGRWLAEPVVEDDGGDPIVNPDAPEQKKALLPVLEANYHDNLGSTDCWTLRRKGGIISIRNANWPGAVSLGWAPTQGTPNIWKYANVYVGYGTKFAAKAYTPPPPPMICQEYTPPVGTDDYGARCCEHGDEAILKDPHPLEDADEEDDE